MVAHFNHRSNVTHSNYISKMAIRKAALTTQFHRTRKLAIDARTKGMNSTTAKKMPFEKLSPGLRQPHLIKVVELILHRVCVLTTGGLEVCPTAKELEKINVRVFIASFMIAWHPKRVFESEGALEKDLTAKAIKMLKIYDQICDDIIKSENWLDLKDAADTAVMFHDSLHAYLEAFQAWKIPDEHRLKARITHALNALQEADDELLDYEIGFESIRSQLRAEKKRLLEKLRKIIGCDAVKMIQDLRLVMGKSAFTTEVDVGASKDSEELHQFDMFDINAGPRRLSNQQIAHELLLDPTFEIKDYGGYKDDHPACERMRATFHKAFWDSLADDLRFEPAIYVRTLLVFQEIKKHIKGLEDMAVASQIDRHVGDVIDFDLINQMIEKNAFTWETCTKLISDIFSLMKHLNFVLVPSSIVSDSLANCNGTRKRNTPESERGLVTHDSAAWATVERLMAEAALDNSLKPVALCEAVKFLLNTIQYTAVTISNKRIKAVLPIIQEHGLEYERDKLNKLLSTKSISLMNITALIHLTISNDVTAGRMNIEDLTINDSAKAVSYTSIMNSVLVELIVGTNAMTIATFPELWVLDKRRIFDIQTAFKFLVRVGCVVVIIGNNMRDAKPMAILDTIIQRLVSAPDSAHDLKSMTDIIVEGLEFISEMDKANREKIRELIFMNASDDGKLAKLLKERYRNVLLNGLCGDIETFKDNDASLALFTAMKIPKAIRLVSLDIRNLGLSMRPMMALHTRVHSGRYNEIIAEQSKIVASQYAK